MPASNEAWAIWFGAWFVANWLPDDVPALRQVIRLYDDVERGTTKATDKAQLHTWMRSYGITPDGQIALRWARPKPEERSSQPQRQRVAGDKYGHLSVLGDE